MTCKLGIVFLPCSKTGRGFTAAAVEPNSTRVQLMNGHGSHFPDITNGGHFYVRVAGCNSCCETMKVIDKDGDVLIVDRNYGTQCNCIHSNSVVEYSLDNPYAYNDLSQYIPLTVTDPLQFNCETNTLSVDCAKLFSKSCGCDCDGNISEVSSSSSSGAGLRGEKGEKGDTGVGIESMTVSAAGYLIVTLDNGKSVTAGKLPVAKGTPGETGPKGDKGDRGEQGEPGVSVMTARQENDKLIFEMSDGTTHNVGSVIGPQGEQGKQGEQGPQGEAGRDGDLPYVNYVNCGAKARLFAASNKTITIKYMTFADAAELKAGSASVVVTTNSAGNATLPAIPTGNFLEFYQDGRLIGIGVS